MAKLKYEHPRLVKLYDPKLVHGDCAPGSVPSGPFMAGAADGGMNCVDGMEFAASCGGGSVVLPNCNVGGIPTVV